MAVSSNCYLEKPISPQFSPPDPISSISRLSSPIISCFNRPPNQIMCYYRLIKFNCLCPTRELWISECPTPEHGSREIEGVLVCLTPGFYTPSPQTVQQICMACFNELNIGRSYVASSHYPEVRIKVNELDCRILRRNWKYLMNLTEEKYFEFSAHHGQVLRVA